MRLYIVETRNFEFHIFADHFSDFKKYFQQAWAQHCKDYNIYFDAEFFNELLEESNYIEVKQGTVYRDKQLMDIPKIQKKFLAVWGVGYVDQGQNAKIQSESLNFFSEDNGFDPDLQESLSNLHLGACESIHNLSGIVSIVRVR